MKRIVALLAAGLAVTATGKVKQFGKGLHGYIGFSATRPNNPIEYSAGMGFYSAVWSLIDQPIAHFQVGLASTWITPDNSDNKNIPLAPEGTRARNWPERGPTWSSVFQTLEGGLGYWAGNRFHYGLPKFCMNGTPQCYDYEIATPGWSFFHGSKPLPDDRLGIAQLSNSLLIPPDGLPFKGHPNGEFIGYSYMALPFTDPVPGKPPTGEQSWTCFLNTANFKGPIAYYIPETWSKIGKLFNYPFIHGRGLDTRPGKMLGGAMEINTIPRLEAQDSRGVTYSKLPKLEFPVDEKGWCRIVQDVIYYSKAALYDAFKRWRNGGPACTGRFDQRGAFVSVLRPRLLKFYQNNERITGIESVLKTRVFPGNVWGLEWTDSKLCPKGQFPQFYRDEGDKRVAVCAEDVPAETRLHNTEFERAKRGKPYSASLTGAWANPGPAAGPFRVHLIDGSTVTNITGAKKKRPGSRRLWKRFTLTGLSIATTCLHPPAANSLH